MSVTFATPVSAYNAPVALTGVSLGQPIVLIVEFSGPSNTVTDTFATHYTWTQVDQVSITTSYGNTAYKTTFIGTGGYGSSGSIKTSGSFSILTAIACAGASGASGLSAIDVHGSLSGNSLTIGSPSLTPTAANEGAIMSTLCVETPEFNYLSAQPSSPWISTLFEAYSYGTSPPATSYVSGVALYPSPPTSALSPSWTQVNPSGATDNDYLSLGLVLKAFTAIAPNTPTLQNPANASYVDVASGYTFTPQYNAADNTPMQSYQMRIRLSGGTYGYWNGTNFSSTTPVTMTLTALPGATFSVAIPNGVALPGGTFANAHAYNYSFACSNSAGAFGSFASDDTFNAQLGPITTVSAPTGSVHGTTQPAIQWASTYPGSATQIAYRIVIESGSYGTVPGSGIVAWDSGTVTSAALSVLAGTPLSVNTAYRAFVLVTETGPENGVWAYNTFTLVADLPGAPTVTVTAITDPITGLPKVSLTGNGVDNGLTASQSSLEDNSASGWPFGSNVNLAPSNTWSQDGAYSLRIQCVAAGTVFTEATNGLNGVPCVAGQTVRATASFHSPTTVRSCFLSIVFFNSSGTQIGSAYNSPNVNSTLSGNGGQAFLAMTAPAGAAFMSLSLTGLSLATNEYLYADCMLLGPSSPVPNLLSSPNDSFNGGLGAWVAAFNCTTALLSYAMSMTLTTSTFSMEASTSAGGLSPTGPGVTPVTAGSTYTAMASFMAATTSRTPVIMIDWFNSSGTKISTSTGSPITDVTTGWVQASITAIAPAGATTAGLRVDVGAYGTGGNPVAGEVHYVSKAGFVAGSVAAWSFSALLWSVGGFVGTTEIVIQCSDGRYVRGASPSNPYVLPNSVTQAFTIYDTEAPTNTPVTYYVFVVATNSGNPLTGNYTQTAAVTIPSTVWWIWSPINPSLAVGVNMMSKTTATLASGGDAILQIDQDEDQGQFLPFGRSDTLVVHGDMRGEYYTLGLVFTSDAQWNAFKAIRALQSVVAVRSTLNRAVDFMTIGPTRPTLIIRGDVGQTGGPNQQATISFLPSVRPAP